MVQDSIGMKAAAIIQFGSKYASIALQLLVTAMLSRLLSPADFGLISIVSVFTSFFTLFSDLGIGTAVVQYQDLSDDDCSGLFCFSIILSFLLCGLFIFAAYPISSFYGDERLFSLCIAVCPSLLFSSLNMVPNGLMLKKRRFRVIGIRLITTTALSGLVAIVFAMSGFAYYALALQTVVNQFLIFIWNYLSNPILSLNWHFIKPLKRVYSYSLYQFGFSFINYFSRNMDNLVIGRVFGSVGLGYYDKAYKLTTYPLNSISSVLASVVQPYMASHQDDRNIIFNAWLKITRLLSMVAIYISVIFFTCSGEIIELFYGSQWGSSVPLFSILSVTVYFQMLGNPTGAFFQSLGRTDLMFKAGCVNTCLTMLGLCGGVVCGTLSSVSVGIALAFSLHIASLAYYLIIKGFGRSGKDLLIFVPDVIVGTCSALAVLIICQPLALPVLLSLCVKGALSVLLVTLSFSFLGRTKALRQLIPKRK